MTTTELPPLDSDRIDAMEQRIVNAHRTARSIRRRRIVGYAGAAASVLVVAAIIGPTVAGGGMIGGASSESASTSFVDSGDGMIDSVPAAPDSGIAGAYSGITGAEGAEDLTDTSGRSIAGSAGSAAADANGSREIVTTASASVRVPSVPDALTRIAATATELGGYVEASDNSANGTYIDDRMMPAPQPATDSGYITIRVPADRLTEAQDSLGSLGTILSSSTNRQDVTTQAIDLRARIDAAQASVDRLQTLIAQAGNVTDLLAAEAQLADRQATLESYQQQLTALEGQVSLSTLSVSLIAESSVQAAEPAGFFDGLVSGWNGLIASANGLLIGLGFLLPWLVVAGVIVAVVIGVRRVRRHRRAARG